MIITSRNFYPIAILAGIICLIFPQSSPAENYEQADSIVKFQGSYQWNGLNDILLEDNLIYAIYISGLEIYSPLEGFLGQDTLAHLPLTHSYQSGFKLINELVLYDPAGYIGFVYVNDPHNPRVIAENNLETPFLDVAYKSLYVYLACGFEGVKLFDFSRRDDPVQATTLPEPAHVVAVEIYEDYLYAIDDYNGIYIYDLSADLADPVYLGRQLYTKQIKDMTIAGQTAYCANTEGGIVELDLSDPSSPEQVRIFDTQTRTDRVYILGEYIFGNDAYGNYEIFHPDSNVQTAYLVRKNLVTAPVSYSDRSGDYLAAVDSAGVGHIFRILPGWELREIAALGAGSGWNGLYLQEGYLYAAALSDFLSIFGMVQNFKLSYPTPFPAHCTALCTNRQYMYLADNYAHHVWIVDISSPGQPVVQALVPYEGEIFKLAAEDVLGERVALVMFSSERALLYYLDENDFSVLEKTDIPARKKIFSGALYLGYAYLFDADLEGHMYAINNFTGPADFADFVLQDTVVDVDISSGNLYAAGLKSLALYDIGQGVPFYTGKEFPHEGGFTAVKKHFLKVLATAGEEGLFVFEQYQSSDFGLLAHCQTPGYANAVAAFDSLVIISDKYNLSLYELNDEGQFYDPLSPVIPARFRVFQNYPNPFNQATIINLDIPESAGNKNISLVIYNVLGQKMRTLVDSPLSPGKYRLRWDGCDDSGIEAASGIYFYRCQGAGTDISRKMVLIK